MAKTKRNTQILIRLSTDNAAFEDDNRGVEVARILRKIADEYESVGCNQCARLYDCNGNRTGEIMDESR